MKNPIRYVMSFLKNLSTIFGICALTSLLIISPITIKAQQNFDSTGVKDLVAAYQIIWNTRNTADIAKMFSEDADMVFGNFPSAKGREAIAKWWQKYFSKQESERRGWFDIRSIKFLSPEAAMVDLGSTTGIMNDTSTFRKARGTWLVHNVDGKWMIEAMRGLPTTKDHIELVASIETTKRFIPQIRAFVDNYENVFNTHDSEALSTFFTADADIMIREQPIVRGIQAIREWWRAYFDQPRPYQALFIVDEIRMLSEDVALININATGASLESTDQLSPVRQAFATWVVLRVDGKWRISTLRVLPGKYDRVIRN